MGKAGRAGTGGEGEFHLGLGTDPLCAHLVNRIGFGVGGGLQMSE